MLCEPRGPPARPQSYENTQTRAHKRLPLEVGLCIVYRVVSSRLVDTSCTVDRGQCTAIVVVMVVAVEGRLFWIKTTTQ
jgi:hypothetical protein